MTADTGNSPERRNFTRITFDAKTTLSQDALQWPAKLVDISLRGLLLEQPDEWHRTENNNYIVTLELDNAGTAITMSGHIAHIDEQHIGFKCDYIDLDSISHLKRLVELHLGDQSLLERELAALV